MPPPRDESLDHLLDDRIYFRMEEVAVCGFTARLLLRHGGEHRVALNIGHEARYEFCSLRQLSNPILDTGIMMCRVLTEFLGLKFSPKPVPTGKLVFLTTPKYATDINLFSLIGRFITMEDVNNSHKTFNADDAEKALFRTLRAANQGIGHLTPTLARDLDLTDLDLACQVVMTLVNDHLYAKLGRPRVNFPGLDR